jgi:hypothetical protein
MTSLLGNERLHSTKSLLEQNISKASILYWKNKCQPSLNEV